jgi:histidinol-phosphate aminotransferase
MDFARTCEQAGITVRPFDGEGVRITIGEPAANDRLLAIASDWVAAQPS